LWTGLAAAVVITTLVTGWVQLSEGESTRSTRSAGTAASTGQATSVADALLQAGLKQGEIRDFAGAEATFKRVLDLEPKNKLAWYNLGVVAQHNNRTADARKAYDHALGVDPHFKSALYNKALLVEQEDPDQAVELLQRVVATDSKAATAYLHLGQALAKKGRDEAARDAFVKAAQADPSLEQLVPDQFRDSASAAPSPSQTATQAGTNK
jgi:Flp pilus assembly protein TadD